MQQVHSSCVINKKIFLERIFFKPIKQPLPIFFINTDNRNNINNACLHMHGVIKKFIERSITTGIKNKCLAFYGHNEATREKKMKRKFMSKNFVSYCLFFQKLCPQSNGGSFGFRRTRIGGVHNFWSTTTQDSITSFTKFKCCMFSLLIKLVFRCNFVRSEESNDWSINFIEQSQAIIKLFSSFLGGQITIRKIFFVFMKFIHRIKKFSSLKIKIWFEPMFFSGFFCGFERCGSAAFPNFSVGIFSEKCVRTNSRILHQKGNCKFERFASLRSATNWYSILGVKTNSRFRILGEENFLILNF